jgi:hypothetical protein
MLVAVLLSLLRLAESHGPATRLVGLVTGGVTGVIWVLVPLRLFTNRTFTAANATGFLMTGSIIAAFGYRSIFAILGATMLCDLALLLSIDESAAQRQSREPARNHALLRPLPAVATR